MWYDKDHGVGSSPCALEATTLAGINGDRSFEVKSISWFHSKVSVPVIGFSLLARQSPTLSTMKSQAENQPPGYSGVGRVVMP